MTPGDKRADKKMSDSKIGGHPVRPAPSDAAGVQIGLNAAIVAVTGGEPVVEIVRGTPDGAGATGGLPFGPFSPIDHRTLEIGLRAWVSAQTGLDLGYVEQLYTFGDRGRHAQPGDAGPHIVSIGYLALTRTAQVEDTVPGTRPGTRPGNRPGNRPHSPSGKWPDNWHGWYHYFPWEDWRRGRPEILDAEILPRLKAWSACAPTRPAALPRQDRVRLCFGQGLGQNLGESFGQPASGWDEEKVLERYELLYEAGLVGEAKRDGREAAASWNNLPPIGAPMRFDHRRILATAIGRVRAKIKYRPVIFELVPDEFTLYELQKTVEAILGPHLHKQNFRRLVMDAGLVEATGEVKAATGGRPAQLYRFRREVLLERPAPGVRINPSRT